MPSSGQVDRGAGSSASGENDGAEPAVESRASGYEIESREAVPSQRI